MRGRPGEVRFEGFGPLRGQNGPHDRARSAGEQTKSGSWGGPFWRIWAAQRTKRSTRERKEHRSTATGERRTQNKRTAGQARFEAFRRLSYQGGPPDTARSKQTRTGRAGEVRFDGFGPLSGQNGQPERGRSTAKQMKSRRARKVRFDGLGQLSGQNGPPDGEKSTESEPREKGAEQLGKQSRCHQAQHAPHKETIDGTKCHACHATPHLASQRRDRVTVEETRPRHR